MKTEFEMQLTVVMYIFVALFLEDWYSEKLEFFIYQVEDGI